MTIQIANAEPGSAVLRSGLAGRGILESRSPWMHEQEGRAQGLDLTYELFDFTQREWADGGLGQLLDAAQQAGFAGINITSPFKQAVLALLDGVSVGACGVGAVNTVSFTDGKRIGYNTDVTGFAESFTQGLPDAAMDRVVQIGAGGAGSATARALLESGVDILTLFDTDAACLAQLTSKLQADFGVGRVAAGHDLTAAVGAADGLVNATPVGMAKLPGLPLPAALIEPRHWVADIVYFPLETELLREARQRGCRTLNGSGMAIHQAAGAFEIFTGLAPDRERMKRSFVEFASERVVRTA